MDRKKAVRVYHRNLAILVGLVLLTFILIPAMVKSPYMLNIFVLTFYMSTLSMAWNLLGGMTGQNSLGHAAYMGLGAYACCLLVVKTGANPWLAAIFGMVVVGLVAGIVFYPCFILRGPYFTLVSIAFGESIRQVIINSEFFGRASGVGLPFGQDSWLNFRFASKVPYYYVGLAMMVGIDLGYGGGPGGLLLCQLYPLYRSGPDDPGQVHRVGASGGRGRRCLCGGAHCGRTDHDSAV